MIRIVFLFAISIGLAGCQTTEVGVLPNGQHFASVTTRSDMPEATPQTTLFAQREPAPMDRGTYVPIATTNGVNLPVALVQGGAIVGASAVLPTSHWSVNGGSNALSIRNESSGGAAIATSVSK